MCMAAYRENEFAPFVFVLAGNHPLRHVSKTLLNWLRRLDRHGATLGGDRYRRLCAGGGRTAQGRHRDRALGGDRHVQGRLPGSERRRPALLHRRKAMVLRRRPRGPRHDGRDHSIDCGLSIAQLVADSFLHSHVRQADECQRPTIQGLVGTDGQQFAEVVERHGRPCFDTPERHGTLPASSGCRAGSSIGS